MSRPSFPTYRSGARAGLRSGALALAAIVFTFAFAFAFCIPSQAGAQTHRAGVHVNRVVTHTHKTRTHARSAGAGASNAACPTTHAKHGSHACAPAKGHKHKTKTEAHRKHAAGSHHTPSQGKAQTPPAPGPGGSSGTTCPDGLNATLNEEGTFSCASGGEPGCQEDFAPVVAGDGSTLVCEPEPGEAGGEEEG